MNPERFDTSMGALEVDENAHAMAFLVTYSNPINDANDPQTARQTVVTTCTSMDRVDRISCRERSLSVWADALKLPETTELLKRAAASPNAVP
jgi:hypothetical protein